ncbi:MAG: SBBP repeat-containing protein [Flavobacteriaceae bacterium]|nr:SBBP repeat-containing protein [Flavobacteriaceae bacterium]
MGKKYLTFILLHYIIYSFAQTPTLEWVNTYGNSGNDWGSSIAIDAFGDIYNIGDFENTIDFDSSGGVANLTSNGLRDIFIQKLDNNGSLIWAKSIGGVSNDNGKHVTIDTSGNVYLTGYFTGTVDFDPSASIYNLTSHGENDIYILKLDTNGSFLWAKALGGTGYDNGKHLSIDTLGNIYITGKFQQTVDFDPSSNTFYLTSTVLGNDDVFILKLDANGDFIWAKSFGGDNYDSGASIAIDSQNNIYITGSFRETTDFDPSSNTFYLTSNTQGIDDIYVLKLDTNGAFIWVKSFGGIWFDFGLSIAIDTFDNIYISSLFEDTVDFDPSSSLFELTSNGVGDISIQKLDSNGNFIWAKSLGGTSSDYGLSINIDTNNDLYLTGYFENTVDFDNSSSIFNITSNGNTDVFIQKLDSNGDFIWATSIGGVDYDRGLYIMSDNLGNVYTTGFYQNSVDFDPSATNHNLSSVGGSYDAFIQKLNTNTLSVDDSLELTRNLTIYPNPTNDYVSIVGVSDLKIVEVISITGKRVQYIENANKRIDISGLDAGIYFIKITTENGILTTKIVKQ